MSSKFNKFDSCMLLLSYSVFDMCNILVCLLFTDG